MKYCVQCGTPLTDDAVFCQSCGHRCGSPAAAETAAPNAGENFFDTFTANVNHLAGGKGAVRPPLKHLFGKIFTKHAKQEAEEIFICGTASTTPQLSSTDTAWPQPWLYTRILLAFALALLMLHLCCVQFGNLNTYPGVIFLGSFMVPVSMVVFFFELNTPKNISFFTTIKIFLVGGCASLLFTLLLFDIVPVGELDYVGATLVGIIEEVGKLAIVAFFIHQEKDAKYTINGLLIGAIVGAGFAAFESAGYAFRVLLEGGYDAMMDNIILRAVLAPGGHIVWAAMSGYAIMLVKGDAPLNLGFLSQSAFWKIFWIPIAIHAVWDMPITIGSDFFLVQILMFTLSWIVIFVIINNCLAQIGAILQKQASGEAVPSPVESSED